MTPTPRNDVRTTSSPAQAPGRPGFRAALGFWLKLGFISFGGPSGQIAIMHEELVTRRRWISERRFLHALNYCMLLPGPEAQQLATYVGWLLHRTWGGIAAGALFVLPSALILWGLSVLYVLYGHVPWMAALFDGLKPAVLAIVLGAVIRIGGRVLKNAVMWSLALAAFVLIFGLHLPFPLIILGAGLVGFLGGQRWPAAFVVLGGHATATESASVLGDADAAPDHAHPSWGRSLKVAALGLTLWWTPVLLAGLWLGFDHLLVRQGLFFSKAAMVTFGGAYAVLPYVSQQAVGHYQWVSAGQMLDGLGLAETTPGPLIMVLQFVGFLGGWKFPAPLSPLGMATLGAFMTTWTTFLPCFLWIFLGAPYIEQLRDNARLTATLSAITAAVVGVILNLALWFGLQVLFPAGRPVHVFGLVVFAIAFVGLVRWKWGIIPVVLGSGLLGLAGKFLTSGP
ncbi:MAG: chromate efflux transporter [Verrucomicrobia bacterium]|nr:chromate efflux transporter [Verrucomicrobiota bacterium]